MTRMPPEREGITHKFRIRGEGDQEMKGFISTGVYPDGRLGEVFITLQKKNTAERGLCRCLALLISVALQNGVPLEKIVEKLEHTRFEPAGMTTNHDIPMCKSITDYLARWLRLRYLPKEISPDTAPQPPETGA